MSTKTFELKAIERTDRAQARLNSALSIYRETILPEAQNPERQIIYWIDHSKDALTDEFRCFAIQRGLEVIGYLQYSYFREEHIFFFEYLCIRDSRRVGLLPSAALKAIERFLVDNYRADFTIVFECARKKDSVGNWLKDTKLVDYFQHLGFRVVSFDYQYPILQSFDGAISYPADLMVRLPGDRETVTSYEMRTILRCIYFKHYLRWDRPFLKSDQFKERERLINELYTRQISQIGSKDNFTTAGSKRRTIIKFFADRGPSIRSLLVKIFGPKLPRLLLVIVVLLMVQWLLGSGWLLVPFVLAVSVVYCLAEDTKSAEQLLVKIIAKLSRARPLQS